MARVAWKVSMYRDSTSPAIDRHRRPVRPFCSRQPGCEIEGAVVAWVNHRKLFAAHAW
jgi:hypothetical protein